MLAGLRYLIPAVKSVKDEKWEKHEFMGHELKDKVVGLVGFGHIGKAIAKLLEQFQAKII